MTVINLRKSKKGFVFTAKGHCGAGENGVDLVCSAVSILSCTLINRVEKLENMLSEKHITVKSGDVEIICAYREKDSEIFDNCIDTVMCGYRLLANSFPKNIKLSVIRL